LPDEAPQLIERLKKNPLQEIAKGFLMHQQTDQFLTAIGIFKALDDVPQ
jgi:hypothetical protein